MGSLTIPGLAEPTAFSAADRFVMHNALLAQVDDVHAGGVYCWTAEQFTAAERLIETLTDGADRLAEIPSAHARAVVCSLIVPVHDVDHPALSHEEWEAAEGMLTHLAVEFGR